MQIVIAAMIPPRERGRYNGYLGAVMAVATVAGPLLGGLIVDTSWLALVPQACAELEASFAAVVAEVRDTAKRAAQEYGVPITLVTRRGDPFGQLRDVADETKADMVFVGASAQAGHRFVGSIATRLVRLGRWPVVVVP